MTRNDKVIVADIWTSDFDEMREALLGWEHQYRQIEAGRFRGRLLFSQVRELQISRNVWGRRIHYQGIAPKGYFGLALTLEQRGYGRWLSIDSGPNDILVQQPHREAEFVAPEEWDALVVAVSEDEIVQTAIHLGCDPERVCGLHGLVKISAKAAARLRQAAALYLNVLEDYGQNPIKINLLSSHAQHLCTALVSELLDSHNQSLAPPPARSRHNTIRRAEELVSADFGKPISIRDICAMLEISERTLHYAFRDVRGQSPATWLRNMRLNRARQMLKNYDPSPGLVKHVAMLNGFLHLSHFSQRYENLFSELPSETLRCRKTE